MENEPYFITFANRRPVTPATDDTISQFTKTLMRAKGILHIDEHIDETQARLINLLNEIIKYQRIEDSEDLRFFLSAYGISKTPAFDFVNGKVVKSNRGRLFRQSTLAIDSLVDFLVRIKLQKLKQCPYCKKFFIAKDTKRKICYVSRCFREYKQEHKRQQRERDPLKYM